MASTAGERAAKTDRNGIRARETLMTDYSKIFDLSGRTALVIGGGSGIGRESCSGLASFGARVICADIEIAKAKEAARAIGADGHPAEALQIDLCDGASITAAARSAGAPDVLVISPSINVRKPLLDITEQEFDRIVELNLKGVFRALKAFAPGMAQRGKGSIIAFSSIRAQVVEPGQSVYAATKAGTLQMMRALAAELAPSGVRANVIAPGIVETPLTHQIKQDAVWYRAYADKSILGRWASPSELVGAVVYLASDASSYVTGSSLLVDGGWTAVDGRFAPPLPAAAHAKAS
jgi:NAD(P)-dependent dehydrogenase (short-subunit alcohol dehydrogenase family)